MDIIVSLKVYCEVDLLDYVTYIGYKNGWHLYKYKIRRRKE